MKRTLVLSAIAGLFLLPLVSACSHHRGHHKGHGAEHAQKMDEHHARLDELVHQMNTTTGQAKIDATAAVVNEMLRFRKARHGKTCKHGKSCKHGKTCKHGKSCKHGKTCKHGNP